MNQLYLVVLTVTILSAALVTSCSTSNRLATGERSLTSATQPHADTLAFTLTSDNNIQFDAVLNGTDSIKLFFDTGATDLVMVKDALERQTTLLDLEPDTYEFKHYNPLTRPATMQIGSMTFDSMEVWPFPEGPDHSAGHFGWDLFKETVVELNYDDQLMIVHAGPIDIPAGYSKLEIKFVNELFCINGSIIVDGKTFTNRYLFDTGFQRAVVLDKALRAQANFPTDLEVVKESRLTNSEGTVFVNQVVIVDQLCFGEACASEVAVQFFETPNPARFEMHILGGEFLKRFNTILDVQNGAVYLKPNGLMAMGYADAGQG